MPVVSPIAWYHYQVLLLPAVAWLVARALGGGRWRRAVVPLLLLAVATWQHPLSFGAYATRPGWTAEAPLRLWIATSIATAADVTLIALVGIALRRERRVDA